MLVKITNVVKITNITAKSVQFGGLPGHNCVHSDGPPSQVKHYVLALKGALPLLSPVD
jgi:hypothetical protein